MARSASGMKQRAVTARTRSNSASRNGSASTLPSMAAKEHSPCQPARGGKHCRVRIKARHRGASAGGFHSKGAIATSDVEHGLACDQPEHLSVNKRGAQARSSRKKGRHYPGIPGRHYPVIDGRLRRNRHTSPVSRW